MNKKDEDLYQRDYKSILKIGKNSINCNEIKITVNQKMNSNNIQSRPLNLNKVTDGFNSKQNILDCKMKEKMKKVVDQQQKNLNTNSKSFFNQNDQIWENQTQSNYKNNIYYQEFLNTSKNVSSNDNLLNSIKKTHLQSLDNDYLLTNNFINQNTNSNNHLSHTQSFYLSNNTESSEKSNSNSNINYHHSSFNYQFTSNTPHLIYQEKQDPRYQICLDKVLDDKRTTLMIANIPNKYKMSCLINEIDGQGYRNQYNFFYVPVDFNNNCNRGYAFINFIHQKYIYQFFLDFNNRKWSMYNSDKISKIKYGSIQGFDYLVKHFHTASIMKDERYKPFIRYDIRSNEQSDQEIIQIQEQSFILQ